MASKNDKEVTVVAELQLEYGAKLPSKEERARIEADGGHWAVPMILNGERVIGFDKAWTRAQEIFPDHYGPVTIKFLGFIRKEVKK